MSLFPRFTQEISPLLRLINDYDRISRDAFSTVDSQIRAFTPRFDVKEVKDAYELHGELPGIDPKDVSVEWIDSNTLTISGRTESRYDSAQPTAEPGEKHSHQKSVIEKSGNLASQADGPNALSKSGESKEIAKSEDLPKYWISERSIGEFHRTFSFPGHVVQDSVKATLKNGILTVVVSKAQKPQARRINIE